MEPQTGHEVEPVAVETSQRPGSLLAFTVNCSCWASMPPRGPSPAGWSGRRETPS